MSNEDLLKYIVKFGDRCVVCWFCIKVILIIFKVGNLKKNIFVIEVKEKIVCVIFKRWIIKYREWGWNC